MDNLTFAFILIASTNILIAIDKWVKEGKERVSEICGWSAAILWCVINVISNTL